MEKRIEFTGVDNGLNSMINKLRQDSRQLGADLIREARTYSSSTQDQISYINDQIRAIEQRNRLEQETNSIIAKRQYETRISNARSSEDVTAAKEAFSSQMGEIDEATKLERTQVSLLRELIDTIKMQAREEIAEDRDAVADRVREFNKTGAAASPEDALKLGFQGQFLGGGQGNMTSSVFQGMLAANIVKELSDAFKKFPGAQNELDLITPGTQLMGTALGGGVGTGIDALSNVSIMGFSKGETDAGIIGSELGRQIGAMLGEGLRRTFKSRFELAEAEMGLRGLTGEYTSISDSRFQTYGMSRIQASQMMQEVARAAGTGNDIINQTDRASAIQRAFSMDQGEVLNLFRTSRITGEQGREMQNLTRYFQELVNRGIMTEEERTLFSEYVQNSGELVQTFGQQSEDVSTERAQEVLMMFNRMGGIFSMSDPRSMQNIQSINQTLANPQNDYVQAATYQALRTLPGMENAGLFDLYTAQKEGLNTPGYLNAMMGQIVGYGGNEDMTKMMMAQLFQGLSPDAVNRLFQSYITQGSITPEAMAGEGITFTEGDVRDEAARNVTQIQRSTAEVTDAFTAGFYQSITTVTDKFVTAMGMSIDEISDQFQVAITDAIRKATGRETTQDRRRQIGQTIDSVRSGRTQLKQREAAVMSDINTAYTPGIGKVDLSSIKPIDRKLGQQLTQ